MDLWTVSVPVFKHYLVQLAALLDKAGESPDPALLLQARLTPDMHPFHSQVEIAVNFVYRACAPLAGRPIPEFAQRCHSFSDLQKRVSGALDFLSQLTPGQMEDRGQLISSQAGQALVCLPAVDFLCQYALPNFFFHLTTAFGILRQQGLAVGKADFDGFHSYPG